MARSDEFQGENRKLPYSEAFRRGKRPFLIKTTRKERARPWAEKATFREDVR